MIIRPESISTRRKKKLSLFRIIILTLIIVGSISGIYFSRDWFQQKLRDIFLPENIKFVENKHKIILQELTPFFQSEDTLNQFYYNQKKRKDFLKKINENINVLHYLEKRSPNLNDIYYFLGISYFLKILIIHDFSGNHLMQQIMRGELPPAFIRNQVTQKILKKTQIYLKKLQAINQKEKLKPEIQFAIIVTDILTFRILSPYYVEKLNQISRKQLPILYIPLYEWFYLTLNSNFGRTQKINEYFSSPGQFWKFSKTEQLLIQGFTYYYAKNYFQFIKTYFQYKNQYFFRSYEQLSQRNKQVYKEFLRILMETYYLQKNYSFTKYYMNQLIQILEKEKDPFIQIRIKTIQDKLEQ